MGMGGLVLVIWRGYLILELKERREEERKSLKFKRRNYEGVVEDNLVGGYIFF